MSISDGLPKWRWAVAWLLMSGSVVTVAVGSHDARFLKGASVVDAGTAMRWIADSLIMLAILGPLIWSLCNIDIDRIWNDAFHLGIAPPTATMVVLLQTKKWVSEVLSSKGKGRLLIQLWSPTPRQTPSRPAPSISEIIQGDSASTTIEKLLTLKRLQEQHTTEASRQTGVSP